MRNLNKLLKWRENFVALSLALIIPFTCAGCNSKRNSEQEDELDSIKQEEIIMENNYDKEDEIVKDTDLQEDEPSLSSYLEAIMSIPVMYKNEEYYITYEQVEELIEASEKEPVCNYECDKDLEEEIKNLVSQIENNSIEYVKNNPEYERIIWQKDNYQLQDAGDIDFIKSSFDITLESALKSILNNATNDISEDICKMKDLSIVMQKGIIGNKEDGYTLGSYDFTLNVIYLNIDTIYQNYLEEKETNEEVDIIVLFDRIRCTILHELNHVRQHACSCKIEQNIPYEKIGYSNSISFITESSAESALYNLYQDYYKQEKDEIDYLYYREREKESLILLLGLLHDDMQVEDYYNAIFDSSLADFYQYCGVKSDEEKYLLHKIWYALDSLLLRTRLLFEVTKESSLTVGDLKDIVGTACYVDIFRLVLLHMVEYTDTNPDFPIEDNLAIFNIVKNLIADNIKRVEKIAPETYQYTYEEETANAVYMLEQTYLDFLSEHYQIEKDKLKRLEEENHMTLECLITAHEGEYNPYYFEANYFLIKYPILKDVLAINYISHHEYQQFLEANGFTLSRKLN